MKLLLSAFALTFSIAATAQAEQRQVAEAELLPYVQAIYNIWRARPLNCQTGQQASTYGEISRALDGIANANSAVVNSGIQPVLIFTKESTHSRTVVEVTGSADNRDIVSLVYYRYVSQLVNRGDLANPVMVREMAISNSSTTTCVRNLN